MWIDGEGGAVEDAAGSAPVYASAMTLSCRGGSGWDDVQWSEDSTHVAFVSTSRDHKQEWLRDRGYGDGRCARGDEGDDGDVL